MKGREAYPDEELRRRIMDFIMAAGQTLLENGAEVFRVEQTMEIMAKLNAPPMPLTSCTQSLGKGMRWAAARRYSASPSDILVSAISRERAFTAATRPRWVVRTGTLRTSLISAVPALAKMPLVST